jgi:hypothetical protein
MKRMGLLLSCQSMQVIIFVMLFHMLGGRFSLFRLAIAQGAANFLASVGILILTARQLPFRLRVPREFWGSFVVLSLASFLIACLKPLPVLNTFLLFSIVLVTFFLISGYRWDEIRTLWSFVFSQRRRGRQSFAILQDPQLPEINLVTGDQSAGENMQMTGAGFILCVAADLNEAFESRDWR